MRIESVRAVARTGCMLSAMAATLVWGCAEGARDHEAVGTVSAAAISPGRAQAGKELFDRALANTNGRACVTCHVHEEHTTLTPENVVARRAADPTDRLFDRLDADDPDAETLTFEALEKGLIRIRLPLPDNMDVIDENGAVITPPDRIVSVWRGVPTIENTAYTAPFLYDGRGATLEAQALGAMQDHSELSHPIGNGVLSLIADFERTVFSSDRARSVGEAFLAGVPVEEIPNPEDEMQLSETEQRGRAVYERACAGCHGGVTGDRITNRAAHQQLFFQVDSDGNVVFQEVPGGATVPVPAPGPHDDFQNIGTATTTYLGQIGLFPLFNDSIDFPRYRFRFYTDGTRTEKVTDLPPVPQTVSGNPFDLRPATDPETGAPIVGPAFLPQAFTTDPGRALITGDPDDYEAFDIPQLRGVAHTAPYFHDNSHADLPSVVDLYSRFILGVIPALGIPPVHPPEGPGLPPETLSPSEKDDLLAFLAVY